MKKRLRAELEQDSMLLTETALQNLRARMAAELTQGLQQLQAAASQGAGGSAALDATEIQLLRQELESRLEAARIEVQGLSEQVAASQAQLQSLLEQLNAALDEARQMLEQVQSSGGAPDAASNSGPSGSSEEPREAGNSSMSARGMKDSPHSW
jgi:HPt (histidine-containing phosphotransfer) domain-containing protein